MSKFNDTNYPPVGTPQPDDILLLCRVTDGSVRSVEVQDVINPDGVPGRYWGSGSPEGVVTGIVGSIYQRTDGGVGTSFYVKESGTGNTGWSAK